MAIYHCTNIFEPDIVVVGRSGGSGTVAQRIEIGKELLLIPNTFLD